MNEANEKLHPIYATTRRIVQEHKEGENITTIRRFEFVRFREYAPCR